MRIPFIRWAFVGGICLCVVGVLGQRAVSKPAIANSVPAAKAHAKIMGLLTQRRDLLRKIEQDYRAQYTQGQGKQEDLQRASEAVIRADLDLPHSRAERIALRQRLLDNTEAFEKLA